MNLRHPIPSFLMIGILFILKESLEANVSPIWSSSTSFRAGKNMDNVGVVSFAPVSPTTGPLSQNVTVTYSSAISAIGFRVAVGISESDFTFSTSSFVLKIFPVTVGTSGFKFSV